jgi:predicted PurR-regulated permease PerM
MTKQTNASVYANNLLFIVLLVFVLYVLQPLIIPLLFAIILSISIFPLVKFLERKLRFKRVFSALTAILVMIVVIGLLFTLIGIQISEIVSKSDMYALRLEQIYNRHIAQIENDFGINRNDFVKGNFDFGKTLKENFSNIISFLGASGGILSDIILIPLYMFFFLFYRKFFQIFIYKVFCKGDDNTKVKLLIQKLYKVQQNYLVGLFTVMGIVGLLNSLGLLILGIENPFFYGFLAALLLLIPYVGIIIGSIIPAIIALVTKDSAMYSVGVIGLFSFVQFIEGNFITPKITGSKVSINALVAIVSIIGFSMLWGTSGMILALPIVASLKILFDAIPSLEPYGFVLGEPREDQIKSEARMRLKKWQEIRKKKIGIDL